MHVYVYIYRYMHNQLRHRFEKLGHQLLDAWLQCAIPLLPLRLYALNLRNCLDAVLPCLTPPNRVPNTSSTQGSYVLLLSPKITGISESMGCRILMLMVFWAPYEALNKDAAASTTGGDGTALSGRHEC